MPEHKQILSKHSWIFILKIKYFDLIVNLFKVIHQLIKHILRAKNSQFTVTLNTFQRFGTQSQFKVPD